MAPVDFHEEWVTIMEDRVKRMIIAIDILKAVVSGDRYTMISCENRYGRGAAEVRGKERPAAAISKNLSELARTFFAGSNHYRYDRLQNHRYRQG